MTLAEAQAELAAYTTARDAILVGGQEYEMPDGQRFRRADLRVIEERVKELRATVDQLSGARRRTLLRFKKS